MLERLHDQIYDSLIDDIAVPEFFVDVLRSIDIFLASGADPGCFLHLEPGDYSLQQSDSSTLTAIQSFQLGMTYIDDSNWDEGEKRTLKDTFTAIIEKLQQALAAKSEVGGSVQEIVHGAGSDRPEMVTATAFTSVSRIGYGIEHSQVTPLSYGEHAMIHPQNTRPSRSIMSISLRSDGRGWRRHQLAERAL
ncbi:hypothetical protein Slin15195_G021640 [Septoria linicola]|uniref:Uncharacterized protein n=1 Tax=Septoria linicola TaxID=215465 RepID=A0A9Q9AGV6_9PEZI|nr:hypothetical protein Slin14017_G130110 [Septoria linicola]USW48845.1 hypothetical protein Slin15195_G021640 [Septoria linicola]